MESILRPVDPQSPTLISRPLRSTCLQITNDVLRNFQQFRIIFTFRYIPDTKVTPDYIRSFTHESSL